MLTNRELATVLAALRYWQDEMAPHGDEAACYPEHFEGIEPLTAVEIDDLCERLNTEGGEPCKSTRAAEAAAPAAAS